MTAENPGVSALFTPGLIGTLAIKNRLVATPHAVSTVDGVPTREDTAYFSALAAGGVGLIIAGATIPHESSRTRSRGLTEAYAKDAAQALRARPHAVHENGAKIFCQLVHLGREMLGRDTLHVPVAPSAIRSPRDPFPPKALSIREIDDIVAGFAISAYNLREAGYDGVEISGGHGYLVAQFLSPAANTRTDDYGGSPDKRFLFLRRVVDAIRERCGADYPLGIRLSAPEQSPGGLTVNDSVDIARLVAAMGAVDYLSITTGGAGLYVQDMSTPAGMTADAAGRIRAATGMTVIAGHRNSDIKTAARILAAGSADFIGMVRALIADPKLPNKAEGGHLDDIRPCIVCVQDCRAFDGGLFCAVNPDTGRELTPLVLSGTRLRRRVAVIGAGPGGLEAARTAAEHGHDVSLFEQADVFGGQTVLASAAPHRGNIRDIITYLSGQVKRSKVAISLGTEFTAEMAADYEVLIVAAGALPNPVTAPFDGTVVRPWDVLSEGWSPAGRDAIVIDDGLGYWPSLSAVEALLAGRVSVTLVSGAAAVAQGIPYDSVGPVLSRLRDGKVALKTNRIADISAGHVQLTDLFRGETETLAPDILVIETGLTPNSVLARSLQQSGREVTVIGDCITPRRLSYAIWEGRSAGGNIAVAS